MAVRDRISRSSRAHIPLPLSRHSPETPSLGELSTEYDSRSDSGSLWGLETQRSLVVGRAGNVHFLDLGGAYAGVLKICVLSVSYTSVNLKKTLTSCPPKITP